MQHQQENKQEAYTCPLTNKKLINCNVTSCMWHCDTYKNNCSLTYNHISEYDLGDVKGYTINSVNKAIRKGKTEIVKIITLDKYLAWIKENKVTLSIRKKTYLKDVFKISQSSNPLFGIDYKMFGQACLEKYYSLFKEKNPSLKQTKLSFLLGVRENKLKIIQNSIKVKK